MALSEAYFQGHEQVVEVSHGQRNESGRYGGWAGTACLTKWYKGYEDFGHALLK